MLLVNLSNVKNEGAIYWPKTREEQVWEENKYWKYTQSKMITIIIIIKKRTVFLFSY